MFGIGPLELLVVALVAIVVVGPQRLPELMKKFGKIFVQLRRQTHEIRTGFNDVIRDAEREIELDKIKDLKHKLDNVKDGKVVETAIKDAVGIDTKEYHDSHYQDGEYKGGGGDGFVDADAFLKQAKEMEDKILRPNKYQPEGKDDPKAEPSATPAEKAEPDEAKTSTPEVDSQVKEPVKESTEQEPKK